MKLSLLLACAAAVAAGCSSTSGSGGDAGADGAVADGASDGDGGDAGISVGDAAGDGAQACNTLANDAPSVTIQQVASSPPAAQGGTVVDGTYFMTDVSIYTGPSGPSGPSGTTRTTIQISGNTIETVGTGQPPRRNVTLATSGTSFTATDTCPDTNVIHGSYSATTTTLAIFLDGGTDEAGARTVVETFTKQ